MKPSVLIVEDDLDIRESLVDSLSAEGMSVASASDGAQALVYLASNDLPDAIVLDLMMPIMDGIEFRERQLADARIASIPVIVLSANRDARERARALGAAAVLAKPLDFAALVSAIERTTSGTASIF